MWQLHTAHVAGRGAHVELEGLAGLQVHRPAAELADAQLGALDIGHDGDGPAQLGLGGADALHAQGMVGVLAVAEVEPNHVHPGSQQGLDHLRAVAGRPERGDDLAPAPERRADPRILPGRPQG